MKRQRISSRLLAGPTEHDLTRRVLIQGVSASAGMSVLFSIGSEKAHAAEGNPADSCWLVGNLEPGVRGILGIGPSGDVIARVSIGTASVTRSGNGDAIVVSTRDSSGSTVYSTYDAMTGKASKPVTGRGLWAAEPATVTAPAVGTPMVVAHHSLLTAHLTGRTATKHRLDGRKEIVEMKNWTEETQVEVFDAAAQKVVYSSPQTAVELGFKYEVLSSQGTVLEARSHMDGLDLALFTLQNPSERREFSISYPGRLLFADNHGQFFIDHPHGLTIVNADGSATRTDIDTTSLHRATARPFLPSVAAVTPSTTAYADQSCRYVALIENSSGKILASTLLPIGSPFSTPGPGGHGVAADPNGERIFVTDPSGVSGGIWVLDSQSLQVMDRWHSDMQFETLHVAPTAGTVFSQTKQGPVAVHAPNGTVKNIVDSSLTAARSI